MSKEALAVKYRPKRFSDVVEQDVTKAILTEQLENKTFKNCLLFCGGAGTGKAQPLNSKVLTPNGFIKMKKVKVGTDVITGNYKVAKVTEVHPQGKRKVYKIWLSTGDAIKVSDEHINVVYKENEQGSFDESNITTNELINMDYTNLFMRKIVGNGLVNTYYNISKIKYVGLQKCQCIYVDAPEHTYITDNYIVTHNTTSARIFANEINEFKGKPIEIDAASNNSVDDARRIIEDAKTQSLDSEYKVFVLDECFHKSTVISTPKGDKFISDICVGDSIYNMEGISTVTNVFTNNINVNNLTLVHLNNNHNIITTKNHLFFTTEGWVSASNLHEGDVLFDSESMSHLWEKFPMFSIRQSQNLFKEMWIQIQGTDLQTCTQELGNKDMSNLSENICNISFREFCNLWNSLCQRVYETKRINRQTKEIIFTVLDRISMSCMWKNYTGENKEKSQILFCGLYESISKESGGNKEVTNCGSCLFYMWQYILKETFQYCTNLFQGVSKQTDITEYPQNVLAQGITENVNRQSIPQPRNYKKSINHEITERNTTSMDWETWWKWTIYGSTNDSVCRVREQMEAGISNKNTSEDGFRVSYELQSRPCLTQFEVGSRGGWQEPLLERWIITGFQKSEVVKPIRVDSIEIYERGNNEQSFTGYFSDTELLSGFITLYDLEVQGHPSYFANNILVHNCHMLSNAAWNAMLKLVEEPPKKSIFLFCTTDPHKIPDTILSRVQRYNFQKISQEGIVNRLKYIIEQENKEDSANPITYEESALEHIAKVADGGMRDSITLLDKSIGYNTNLTLNNVLEALGSVNYDTMFELTDALNVMDKKKVIEIVETIHKSGLDLKQFIKQYTLFVLDICKYDLFREFTYLQLPSIYKDRLDKYDANAYTFFNQLLNEVSTLSNNLKYESMPKPVVEATFLQLCTEA